jgi:hypothetical protein
VRKDAPFRLLAGLAAFLVILNVLIAQLIIQAFYPGSGATLGPAVMVALAVVAVACLVYSIVGWRAYLRRPPER